MQAALLPLMALALCASTTLAAAQTSGGAGPTNSTIPASSGSFATGAPTIPSLPAPKAETSVPGTAEYRPSEPAQSPATHPQPEDYKVWRLIAPAEADWHASDPNAVRGWFRFDTDARGLGLFVGGSYRLADGLAFAPFAHLLGTVAQPNLALTWQLGALWLMPTLGASMDFKATNFLGLDPQLFAAADFKFVYVEAWAQYFLRNSFHRGAMDTFYGRAMLLGVVSSFFAIGVQGEMILATKNGPADDLLSAPFGGRTNLRIGNHDTVGLFIGYETLARARTGDDGIAGRFEYAHQW